jgi:hypothetical protein
VKNAMTIKDKAEDMSKLVNFVQQSQDKAKHEDMKDKLEQFLKMMMMAHRDR